MREIFTLNEEQIMLTLEHLISRIIFWLIPKICLLVKILDTLALNLDLRGVSNL